MLLLMRRPTIFLLCQGPSDPSVDRCQWFLSAGGAGGGGGGRPRGPPPPPPGPPGGGGGGPRPALASSSSRRDSASLSRSSPSERSWDARDCVTPSSSAMSVS